MTAFSMTSTQVVRFLDQLREAGGLPETVVCGNGPEFTSRLMQRWSMEHRLKLSFIQPGKPTQNAFIESLNGTTAMNALISTGLRIWRRQEL